jgi:type I restriction enzyme ecoKI R protein
MYSNFNFLQNDWQGLAKIGEMAEYNLYKDPNTTILS